MLNFIRHAILEDSYSNIMFGKLNLADMKVPMNSKLDLISRFENVKSNRETSEPIYN